MTQVFKVNHNGRVMFFETMREASVYLDQFNLKFGNVMPGGAYSIYRDTADGYAKVSAQAVNTQNF
jgi:hypothetical protein